VGAGRGLLAQVGQERGALDRLRGEREHRQVARPYDVGRGAARAQPATNRQPIEPRGLGMGPGIVRIHGRGERRKLTVEAGIGLPLCIAHPRMVVSDNGAVGQHPGVLARQVGEGGNERQPELLDKLVVGALVGTDHLAAQLDQPSIRQGRLLDPAARAVARLEHDHVRPAGREIARRAQTRESAAEDQDVVPHPARSLSGLASPSGIPLRRGTRSAARPPLPVRAAWRDRASRRGRGGCAFRRASRCPPPSHRRGRSRSTEASSC
jgi:hypothetical protein